MVFPSPSAGSQPSPFVVSVIDATSTDRLTAGRREAAELLIRSVGPGLADDRFEPYDRPDDGSTLVTAYHGDRAVASIAAGSSRGRLQLDVIADAAAIDLASDDQESCRDDLLISMLETAIAAFDERSATPSSDLAVELWGRPRQDWHDRLAARLDLVPHRTLYQMRCPLPLPGTGTATGDEINGDEARSLDPETDSGRLLSVNNRAFSYHPDQSNQRLEDIEAAFSEPSFRPESVRVLDPDPSDIRAAEHPMIGFCWTKIHPERPGCEAVGEIHVIAVDPAYHGEGHGTALTAAGLGWLAGQGLGTGMLYVESDNDPAVATYRKLGFTVHGTYTAWRQR